MNIEEYRALKAQAEQEQQQTDAQGSAQDVQTQSGAVTVPEQAVQETTQAVHVPGESATQAETQTPAGEDTTGYVEIDGQQVALDELKNGYLRQSDYTRKTQDIAREKERLALAEQYYNAVNSKPEFAKELADSFGLPYKDPSEARFEELNHKYQQELLTKEIDLMSVKYNDFDAYEVVKLATDKGLTSLEDAYKLHKASTGNVQTLDPESLKEQIRQDLLKELQSQVDTGTIIQSGTDATSITKQEPELTPQEMRVAQGLKMTKQEYLAFKNTR